MDIMWLFPSGTAIHRLADTAAKLMETRLQVAEPPSFRDLVSFLVRPAPTTSCHTSELYVTNLDRRREDTRDRAPRGGHRSYPRR